MEVISIEKDKDENILRGINYFNYIYPNEKILSVVIYTNCGLYIFRNIDSINIYEEEAKCLIIYSNTGQIYAFHFKD